MHASTVDSLYGCVNGKATARTVAFTQPYSEIFSGLVSGNTVSDLLSNNVKEFVGQPNRYAYLQTSVIHLKNY